MRTTSKEGSALGINGGYLQRHSRLFTKFSKKSFGSILSNLAALLGKRCESAALTLEQVSI
jgi:hypothetical protein